MRFVACLIAFCAFVSPVLASDIAIGVAAPMTGGSAAFGEQIQHGAQIAIDEINLQGGLLGQTLTLFSNDDACDPKQATNVANKMVTKKVAVVFGHWCAAASMAASSVYGEEGILQIDPGALLVKLTHQGFPNIFRVSATTKTFAGALGRYTVEHNPKAKIAIVTDQPAVTKELTQELETFFASKDNKVIAVEDIRTGDTDFSTVIDKLKTMQPDVVICSCYTIEAGLLARQLSEKQLNVYFYGWDTLNSPDFYNIVAHTDTSKIVSIDYARPQENAAYQKLATALKQHNWPVETYSILTYAAVHVFADAVKEANSFEVLKIDAALHNQKFSTLIGPMSFDKYGDRKEQAFGAYQWDNGQPKMIENIAF